MCQLIKLIFEVLCKDFYNFSKSQKNTQKKVCKVALHWACALDKEKEEKQAEGKGRGRQLWLAVAVAALFINRPHLCRQRCNGFGNRVGPQSATNRFVCPGSHCGRE